MNCIPLSILRTGTVIFYEFVIISSQIKPFCPANVPILGPTVIYVGKLGPYGPLHQLNSPNPQSFPRQQSSHSQNV